MEGSLRLYSIPNAVRLRTDTADYYQQPSYSHDPLFWPEENPTLEHIFFIECSSESGLGLKDALLVEPLDGAQAYPLLLKQAYAFTLKLPGHNQQLLQDYLNLASQVKCYRLDYPQTFSLLDDVLDCIEYQFHESLKSQAHLSK